MIALADCNNFYASCERVFNPGLKNKPVVVLSNNDGCIIARSNEAKDLGIKMGEPVFKVKNLIEKNNVYVFSTNFALYGDMSSRVMSLLNHMSPEIEIYSIDEAFMNFDGIKDYLKLASKMRRTVKKHTGIPISIGIAKTKTLAKIANHVAIGDAIRTYGTMSGLMYRPEDLDAGKAHKTVHVINGVKYFSNRFMTDARLTAAGNTGDSDFVYLLNPNGIQYWVNANNDFRVTKFTDHTMHGNMDADVAYGFLEVQFCVNNPLIQACSADLP